MRRLLHRRGRRAVLLVACAWLVTTRGARAQEIALESHPTRWRVGYEAPESKQGEEFDLVGVHYDLLSPFERIPNLYLGIGGYGAVAGDRAGFFLGGASVGYILPIWPAWTLDGGVFAGAGGGGGRPESQGFAVRPYLALERAFGIYGLRAELAWLDMDEFELDRLYLSLGLTVSSEVLTARERRRSGRIPAEAVEAREMRVTPRWVWLDLDANTRTKKGRPIDQVQVIGIGLDYFLTRSVFVPLEAYGAVAGDVSGFAMAFTGLGVSLPVFDRVHLEAKATAGGGGGGDVDAGGGFGWQAQGGLRFDLTRSLALELLAGRTMFPGGDFDATTATVGLSWSALPTTLSLDYPRGNLEREGLSADDTTVGGTRLSVFHKTYVPRGDAHKAGGGEYDSNLNLIGVGAEQHLWRWFSATGRAFTAWDGNIGGYAEGLFGLKAELEPEGLEGNFFSLHGEAGAAGGGGADVGSGWLFVYGAGYRREILPGMHLSLEVGAFAANHGTFSGEAYTIGLGWDVYRAFSNR